MLIEIIALIFLCKNIGEAAIRKGQQAGRWKFYTVLAWFTAEILGIGFGSILFGEENLFGLFLLGLVSGFGGYLLVKAALDKLPDDTQIEDDINEIGR